MAIVVMDSYVAPGKAVRTLMYEEDSEIQGTEFDTVNAGHVQCEAATIAIKCGLGAVKQLGTDGEWDED